MKAILTALVALSVALAVPAIPASAAPTVTVPVLVCATTTMTGSAILGLPYAWDDGIGIVILVTLAVLIACRTCLVTGTVDNSPVCCIRHRHHAGSHGRHLTVGSAGWRGQKNLQRRVGF